MHREERITTVMSYHHLQEIRLRRAKGRSCLIARRSVHRVNDRCYLAKNTVKNSGGMCASAPRLSSGWRIFSYVQGYLEPVVNVNENNSPRRYPLSSDSTSRFSEFGLINELIKLGHASGDECDHRRLSLENGWWYLEKRTFNLPINCHVLGQSER